MPRITQVPTVEATVETTTTVELSVQARKELSKLLFDRAQIVAWEKANIGTKDKPGRKRLIDEEIAELFRRERKGKALVEGVRFDGTGLEIVTGTTASFDKIGFMKKHGLTQEDFDEFTTKKDNDPYLKVTAPKGAK